MPLAKQIGTAKVVIYNAYEVIMPSMAIDPMVPSMMPIDLETYKNISENGLESI